MEFTAGQDRALKTIDRWFKDKNKQNKTFRLFGPAGTGKTTLAEIIRQSISGKVLAAAYTGKAASVLHNKGLTGATTIHSLIYRSKEKAQDRFKRLEVELADLLLKLHDRGMDEAARDQQRQVIKLRVELADERRLLSRPSFSLNPESELKGADLLLLDEVSMVDEWMGKDLESFGVPILAMGDPFQLKPVRGAGYFTEAEADFLLTDADIRRQALDNPILKLATMARNGQRIEPGWYGDSLVTTSATAKMAMDADQILCGRNATRNATNARCRQLLGFPAEGPVEGDKLVCLRNERVIGILNGTLWKLKEVIDDGAKYIGLRVESMDSGAQIDVEAHREYFQGIELPWWDRKNAQEFDYGNVLTGHKSQGSQWNNVMIFDESAVFRQDARFWKYTTLTRAAERVTLKIDA